MPLYKSKALSYCKKKQYKVILFIHIPKTGGSSIECYLNRTKLFKETLMSYHCPITNHEINTEYVNIFPEKGLNEVPIQHQSFKVLLEYQQLLKFNESEVDLFFSVVRNPYDKIISELFWRKNINLKTDQAEVYRRVKELLVLKPSWGIEHIFPQYSFLTGKSNNIDGRIKILKLETLKEDLRNLGELFAGFDIKENANLVANAFSPINNESPLYNSFLNLQTINLINEIYEKDFEFFGYKQL